MTPPSAVVRASPPLPSSRSDATPANERGGDLSAPPKRRNRRALLALFETHDAAWNCGEVGDKSDSEDKEPSQQEELSIAACGAADTLPRRQALSEGGQQEGRQDDSDRDNVAHEAANVDPAIREQRKRTLKEDHSSSTAMPTPASVSTYKESVDPQPASHEPNQILHKKWKRDGNDTSSLASAAQSNNNGLRPSFTRSMSSQSAFLHKPFMSSNSHSGSEAKMNAGSPALSSSALSSSPSRGDLGPIHKLVLPTIRSKRHPDLNVISPETVSMLLNGDFDAHLASFVLIDCRFSYEYDGGKLKGSQSLCDPARVEEQFLWSPSKDCKRTALIFYCEFSANRAPKMLRHVRNLDRWIHAEKYPELFYPELYLIDGGYKHCYETTKEQICEPQAYTPMNHKEFIGICKQEFALWRKRWKAHKTTACATKFQHRHHCELQREQHDSGDKRTRSASDEDFQANLPSLHPPVALRSFSQML